jgi:hypothetical protein
MKTQKILVGTLTGGVVLFLLGWLIYGILLKDYMAANCNTEGSRPMDQMIWWALILSNFTWGLLLSTCIYWFGVFSPSAGGRVGAVLGLLTGLAFDLGMYSMTTMYLNANVIIVDVIAYVIMFALAGMITAWAMAKVNDPTVPVNRTASNPNP